MTLYTVRLNGEIVCTADWSATAVAAWDRAARNRNAAQHDGTAELEIDGEVVARVRPQMISGHQWPGQDDEVPDIRDVAAAVIQLARKAGVPPQSLAESMTEMGLSTTRSRLKSVSTIEPERRSNVTPAEIIVMCYAAMRQIYKNSAE